MMFWKVIGVLLIAWAGWDLYHGYTFLFDLVYRDDEPLLYWSATLTWLTLGISCFFSWDSRSR